MNSSEALDLLKGGWREARAWENDSGIDFTLHDGRVLRLLAEGADEYGDLIGYLWWTFVKSRDETLAQ